MADIIEIKQNGSLEDIRPSEGSYDIGFFDGKERYICFDLNAFAEMEKLYGSMEEANKALTKGSMIEIRQILWLGCIWQETVVDEVTGEPIQYTITPFQVGRWLNARNMKFIIAKLMASINGNLPEEAKAKLDPATRQALDDSEQEADIAATKLNTDAGKAAGTSPNS